MFGSRSMIADLLESIDFNIGPLPFVTLFVYCRIITYRTGIVQKKKEKRHSFECRYADSKSAVLLHLGKALAAVHRTVGLGLKGNTSFLAASGAGSGEELSGATGSVLAGITARLAALGLILEASLRVEFLLTGSEHKFSAAVLAYQRFVFVHGSGTPNNK